MGILYSVWSRRNSRSGHVNHYFAVDFFERLIVVDTNGKPTEPKSQLKNRIFIAIVVLTNAAGNVLLALGMKQMPDFDEVSVMGYTASLFTNLWVLFGIALLIVWMVAQLSMFSWADLTYVLPVTAAGYIVTAILGKFFLGETVSIMRWAGIVVISFGVVLVSETPPHEPRGGRP
jgi:drug/metabolite transporter (DMT)-like permease